MNICKRIWIFAFCQNIWKNLTKILSRRYNQKLLDYNKNPATDELKTTSKRVIQKTAKTTVNLIGNNITNEKSPIYHKIIQESDSQTEDKSLEILV